VGDAFAQAAHPGALGQFRFAQLQQVLPGARAVLRVGQGQGGWPRRSWLAAAPNCTVVLHRRWY
jgi:hypothetical protein